MWSSHWGINTFASSSFYNWVKQKASFNVASFSSHFGLARSVPAEAIQEVLHRVSLSEAKNQQPFGYGKKGHFIL